MKLYSESVGKGPALVLWHGWGLNLRIFDGLRDELMSDFEVISVDLPGHGASDWLGGAAGQMQLAALLSTVPDEACLLGWSLGGQFAMRAALRAPEKIGRLILMATTPRFTNGDGWAFGLEPSVLAGFAERLRDDWAVTVRDFLELQVRGGAGSERALATLQAALSTQGRGDPAALGAGLELLASTDLRAQIGALSMPTLVISGERDRITPPAAGRALAQAVANGRYHGFARAAHTPFLTETAAVAQLVREFLATPLARPGSA